MGRRGPVSLSPQTLKNNTMASELITRLTAETPKWFKRIIKMGLLLASAGVAIKVTVGVMDDFTLSALGKTITNYMILAGAVAAALGKTAKEDSENENTK